MNFWDKYGRYFKMGIYLILYFVFTFTNALSYIMKPLMNVLGTSKLGYSSYVIILNIFI